MAACVTHDSNPKLPVELRWRSWWTAHCSDRVVHGSELRHKIIRSLRAFTLHGGVCAKTENALLFLGGLVPPLGRPYAAVTA
jgi:hypothetical protein